MGIPFSAYFFMSNLNGPSDGLSQPENVFLSYFKFIFKIEIQRLLQKGVNKYQVTKIDIKRKNQNVSFVNTTKIPSN
jgi:hypothetical protein